MKYNNGSFAFPLDRKLFDRSTDTEGYLISENLDVSFRITDDDLGFRYSPWYVNAYSVVYESIEKFILEAHQHGIIQFIESRYSSKKQRPRESGTKVLTMYMLSAGFYVWLVSVAIACVVFICEHIVSRYSNSK